MAHSQFKESLKVDLHKRVESTVRVRAGPSWDERMEKAVKGFQTKSRASEDEQKKCLSEAIEKGRSRATSAPFRSASETPNQQAMLQARRKKMLELENEYKDHLDTLRDKMEKREPLFRLSDVNNAFAMQAQRMKERKQQMMQDEHERWEHLKTMEESAANRPLLIEDSHFKAPRKTPAASSSAPDLAAGSSSTDAKPTFGGREEYPKDLMIRKAVNSKWFQQTDWGKTVSEIKERADNRQKLHEIQYPNKGDRHDLTRNRLMHALPSQVPGVH